MFLFSDLEDVLDVPNPRWIFSVQTLVGLISTGRKLFFLRKVMYDILPRFITLLTYGTEVWLRSWHVNRNYIYQVCMYIKLLDSEHSLHVPHASQSYRHTESIVINPAALLDWAFYYVSRSMP